MSVLSAIYHDRRFRSVVFPLLLALLWSLSTHYGWVSSLVLVPFSDLFVALKDASVRQSLLEGLAATFGRLLQGAAIGICVGLLLGLGMGMSRAFDRVMGPSFHAVRQVAVLAWVPLLTAWFGNGDLCKIIFVAIAAAMPAVMGAYEGARNAPPALLEVGRILKFTRFKTLRYVILPAAAPAIFTGIQLSLIYSWFAAVGAEYVIGVMSGGIGSVVVGAQEHFRTDIVLLGVIFISLVGIFMNKLLKRLPALLFPWKTRI